jgi:hypothetical protein
MHLQKVGFSLSSVTEIETSFMVCMANYYFTPHINRLAVRS